MKLLVDINVVLDVALERSPWDVEAARLLAYIARERAEGCIAAHTVTTYYYIVARHANPLRARTATTDLLRLLEVVPADASDFRDALALGFADFEDAVQAVAAAKAGADYIVTRNIGDFQGSPIPPRTPGEISALI